MLIHENGDLDFSVNSPVGSGVQPALLNITDGDLEDGIEFEAFSDHMCIIAYESGMLHLTGKYAGLTADTSDDVDIYFERDASL